MLRLISPFREPCNGGRLALKVIFFANEAACLPSEDVACIFADGFGHREFGVEKLCLEHVQQHSFVFIVALEHEPCWIIVREGSHVNTDE